MTTRIRIENLGPLRVRATLHGNEPIDVLDDVAEPVAGPPVVVQPGHAADFVFVYPGRKVTVEEVAPDEP